LNRRRRKPLIATLRQRSLAFLSTHTGAVSLKELSRHLGIGEKEEYRALRSLVDDLERRGIVNADSRGKIRYVRQKRHPSGAAAQPHVLAGTLSMTKRGFGFVKVEGKDMEIFIGSQFLHTALHGDLVVVSLFARRRGKSEERLEGEITEILQRRATIMTGEVAASRTSWFVVPDDERIGRDVYVRRDEGGGARPGDKVVVRLHEWTDEHLNPEGEIVEVLGRAGDPRVEVLAVAHSFGLPMTFPLEAEQEATSLPEVITDADLRGRLDYRKVPCVTIDPDDAMDFDDAVSAEQLPRGGLRLGVHIADVSHYVPEGSALDLEARARGTSVYLVNEVVPMLPERLSNDLCSLKPDVDRLTYSVVMDVNADGTVERYVIGRSVIHSARRFTYDEVQSVLQREKGDHAGTLLPLLTLSRILMKRRRKEGSLDFDSEETKFAFDAEGMPIRVIKKKRLDAHRLIEECMLLANRTVARHVSRGKSERDMLPFLFRVHDVPDPAKLRELATFVRQFGYSLEARNGVSSRELQKLLDKVEGSDVENVINEVALRSMAKAVYSTKNIGHYGLAFRHYTHFTSPIRRYPDLVVHRLLESFRTGLSSSRLEEIRRILPEIARQSSERERVAAEAERASVRVMQVEFMKRHLGDEFLGVISGVTNFGLFVEINDLLIQGLVPIGELSDDYYLLDEGRYALRGRSRGRVFRLGDRVRIRVVAVHPGERQIDFTLAE
jgi:ribonuclease R